MPRKLILCRCEDVTAADVTHAVASGYAGLEEVKRYTGFGTGPCQGKECQRAVALAIAAATGADPSTIQPFTTRPPLAPAELKLFLRGRPQAARVPAPPPTPGDEAPGRNATTRGTRGG